ncbi:NAD(+)/NADH kinase domain protein, partial [Bordetella bronchiseptica B20-10725633]
VLIVIRPDGGLHPLGVMFGLLTACCFAAQYIATRKVAGDDPYTSLIWSGAVGALCLTAALPFILPPAMPVLVPVAPQTLSNRPIVIPDSGVLNMTLTAMGRVEIGASVHFDMQTWSDLQPGDRITVQRAPHTIRFVHPEGYSFFSTLRRKLHWNLMPQATDNLE